MTHSVLIDRFYAAYAARDAAEVGVLYHPDASHTETAMGKSRQGRDAVIAGLEGFWKMLPDVAWQRRGFIRAADHVAVPYLMTGTFTAKDGTARPISLEGLHLFQIQDDQIIASHDLWDLDLFKAQMA